MTDNKLNLYKSLSSPIFKIWAINLDSAKDQCLCILSMLGKKDTYRGIRKINSSIKEGKTNDSKTK